MRRQLLCQRVVQVLALSASLQSFGHAQSGTPPEDSLGKDIADRYWEAVKVGPVPQGLGVPARARQQADAEIAELLKGLVTAPRGPSARHRLSSKGVGPTKLEVLASLCTLYQIKHAGLRDQQSEYEHEVRLLVAEYGYFLCEQGIGLLSGEVVDTVLQRILERQLAGVVSGLGVVSIVGDVITLAETLKKLDLATWYYLGRFIDIESHHSYPCFAALVSRAPESVKKIDAIGKNILNQIEQMLGRVENAPRWRQKLAGTVELYRAPLRVQTDLAAIQALCQRHGYSITEAPELKGLAAWLTPQQLLYAIDFQQGNAPGWQAASGNWRVEDGVYKQTNAPRPSVDYYVTFGDPTWTDYSFEVDVRTNHQDNVSIMGRQAGGACYVIYQHDGSARLFFRQGASRWTQLGEAKHPAIDRKEWHRLGLRFSGRRICYTLDGKTLIEVDHATRASGGIGLMCTAPSEYDNVRVWTSIRGR